MASYSDNPVMQGWELSALFCIFLLITLFWDFLVGFLTFLNDILRGRKANWLTRVKEELLALGVVSLVLLFLEPSLQQICMPSGKNKPTYYGYPPSPPPPPKPYGTYTCSANHRQVFPKSVIHAAHYLLFYLAMVHILFSLLTSVCTNFKLSQWSALERTARKEQNIPAVAVLRMSSAVNKASDPNNRRLVIRFRELLRDGRGFVDQDLYSLLRFMCEKRFRAHSVVLRNFNFLNMCEQCLEAELNEVYSHAWLLVFMMALLLLYNQVMYQIAWISGLCAALMALMSGNLRWVLKKTAREARNLWRKVQGMGGLEHDAYLDGADTQEEQQLERQLQQQQYEEGLDGGGGQHFPQHHLHHRQQLMAGGQVFDERRMRGGNGDLEAGDVRARLRSDQLQQGAGPSPKPSKHLRFAQQPVGEALELAQRADAPWAGEAATAGRAGPAGPGGAMISWPDSDGAGTVGVVGAEARRQVSIRAKSLVDWLEACRASHEAAATSGGRGPGARPQLSLAALPVGCWQAGKAPQACRKTTEGLLKWLLRPPAARRPERTYGVGGGAQQNENDWLYGGGTRGRGPEGQRGGAQRRVKLRPGPVTESTVGNPLFALGGAGPPAFGQPLATVGYAPGGSGITAATGGMYDMSSSMGGVGPILSSPQSLEIRAQSGSGVMPVGAGANLIAATASVPYGGGGITLGVGRSALADPANAGANAVGQWGSNPSSGNPEEGEELGSAGGSDSRSTSSEEQHAKTIGHSKSALGQEEGDEEEDAHSEKSMLEHALASGIEEKITRLFFFGRPFLLLWLFNVIFAQASLTMTMSMAFVIPYDKFDSIREVAMPMSLWLPVIVINLILVLYGSFVFLPQYALLSVCGILEPHEVMEEIKRSKTQDRAEEGVAGIVLEKMTHYWVGHHHGETRLSTVFIVSLASQAGIILGRDYKAAKFLNRVMLKPMFKEFMLVWHDIAWYGDLTSKYKIKTEVPAFREAFGELDEDGSGELSFAELANMIRSLGTYATAGDVEAMLWEIDIDNSHSIGYDEFVKFLVYAFFDPKQLGYIDTPSLIDAMERLGMPINEMQATVLMSVGNCEPGEEVKVTLRQFFGMYEKVVFDDKEDEENEQDGTEPSRKASILSRARDALQAPSALFLGRQASSSRKQEQVGRSKSGSSGHSLAAGAAAGGGRAGKAPSRLAVVSKP